MGWGRRWEPYSRRPPRGPSHRITLTAKTRVLQASMTLPPFRPQDVGQQRLPTAQHCLACLSAPACLAPICPIAHLARHYACMDNVKIITP
jgi:hypothetical protein